MIDLYATIASGPNLKEYCELYIAGHFKNDSYILTSSNPEDALSEVFVDILNFGPKMYKVYNIGKRNGGVRVIAHPAKPLKAFQRDLLIHLKEILPIHEASYAYVNGKSIVSNAFQHKNNKYHLRMDISNFFNSITEDLFLKRIKYEGIKLKDESKLILSRGIFWSPQKSETGLKVLSVGAPSSPHVSNFMMKEFDTFISDICSYYSITYTRYADDMFFSSSKENVLFNIPKIVKLKMFDCFEDYMLINESKTTFSSKAHNRHITGIVISNENKLSLGRSKKRIISSLVHKFKINKLEDKEIQRLQGLLGFAKQVEPDFILRLNKKYSVDTIKEITSGRWKND